MNENIYFTARKTAAEKDGRLKSREGAAELLGLCVSSIASYELGTIKNIPVDIVVMMADLYGAPELLACYCKNECPIGKNKEIVTEPSSIESVAIRLNLALRLEKINQAKETALIIAADGKIEKEELNLIAEIISTLNAIERMRQELLLISTRYERGKS